VRIDLNADLGEGSPHDLELLDSVSSINVACAWHAGSADEMLSLVRAAQLRGIAIGAHPGFADRANFGRREMSLPLDSVRSGLLYQIGALDAMVRAEGGTLSHVKAHGALYNQAAREPELAHCIVRAIHDFDPRLKVMGLAGSVFIQIARAQGLTALEEGFADRGYTGDGRLVARGTAGALIEDETAMLAQVLSMVKTGTVIAQNGAACHLHVDTVCVHGDGPHALAFAKAIRSRLRQEGIDVAPAAA
jgi:5-oxoprolinase (ATP-hydrolysing) subunit A